MSEGNVAYVLDDVSYEVSKFTDEGKIVFARLVEVQKDIQSLTRKIEILQAAAITLNVKIKDQLSEEMKTTVQDAAEAS
tara:strand:+ start:49 stop:285 length:237 start_codon:yes stop_codon:yes gene_type:complete